MSDDRLAPETPVVITLDCEVMPHDEVLLNLAVEPLFRSHDSAADRTHRQRGRRQAGRSHKFRFYRTAL